MPLTSREFTSLSCDFTRNNCRIVVRVDHGIADRLFPKLRCTITLNVMPIRRCPQKRFAGGTLRGWGTRSRGASHPAGRSCQCSQTSSAAAMRTAIGASGSLDSGTPRPVHKLYALDIRLSELSPTKALVERAMKGHVLAEARLIGTYQKGG